MDEFIFNGIKLKLKKSKMTSQEYTVLPDYLISIEEIYYNAEDSLGGFLILKLNVDEPKFVMTLLEVPQLINRYVELYQDYNVQARCGIRIFVNDILKAEVINHTYWRELNHGL